MEHLKSRALYQRARSDLSRYFTRRPKALANSQFDKLPVEIIQQIANYLPFESAAFLSLTCRPLYFTLGTQYLYKLSPSDYSLGEFLNVLEKDLTDHIFCNSCERLHNVKNAVKYTELGEFRLRSSASGTITKCLREDIRNWVEIYINPSFSTTVFKMAMKNHQLFGNNRQTRKLLELLAGGGNAEYIRKDLIKRGKPKFIIRDDCLYTCFHSSFQGTKRGVDTDLISSDICPHLALGARQTPYGFYTRTAWPSSYMEKWSVEFNYEKGLGGKKIVGDVCSGIRQCVYCRTEYRAELHHLGKGQFILDLLVWKNFGTGPESEVWKAHLLPSYRLEPKRIQTRAGAIAEVFRGKGPMLW